MLDNLVIDAFNFLHILKAACAPAGGLKEVIYAIESALAKRHKRGLMVFDGTRYDGLLTSSPILEVIFTKSNQSADQAIELWMSNLERGSRLSWTLVSNDRALSDMALSMGLRVMRCEVLVSEIFQAKTKKRGVRGKSAPFNRPFENL